MAPKRAAAPAPRGRPPKVPKVVDPAVERARCAIELVSEFGTGLTDSAAEMLCSMLPFALKAAGEHQHKFEVEVLQQVQRVAEEAAAACNASVAAAEADVAAHEAEIEASETVLGAARKVEDTKSDAKAAAADLHVAAEKAADAASATVAAAEAAEAEAAEAHRAAVEAKTTFQEALTNTWKSLVEGSVSNWRQRNKGIDLIVQHLQDAEAPASLQQALTLGLKEKPTSRGPFTVKAVEWGEQDLNKRLEALVARVEELQAAHSARLAKVSDAKAEADSKAKEVQAAYEKSEAAENEWAEANTKAHELTRARMGFEMHTKKLAAALAKQQVAQERLRELTAGFEALRCSSAGDAKVAQSKSQEEPTTAARQEQETAAAVTAA